MCILLPQYLVLFASAQTTSCLSLTSGRKRWTKYCFFSPFCGANLLQHRLILSQTPMVRTRSRCIHLSIFPRFFASNMKGCQLCGSLFRKHFFCEGLISYLPESVSAFESCTFAPYGSRRFVYHRSISFSAETCMCCTFHAVHVTSSSSWLITVMRRSRLHSGRQARIACVAKCLTNC